VKPYKNVEAEEWKKKTYIPNTFLFLVARFGVGLGVGLCGRTEDIRKLEVYRMSQKTQSQKTHKGLKTIAAQTSTVFKNDCSTNINSVLRRSLSMVVAFKRNSCHF
jgi:hypothetical protein